MSDLNNPGRKAAVAQTLDGDWFRRERQWIAMGRKPLALRLGITEHKLTMLELRSQDVPQEWLRVLAGLGFRIPQEVAEQIPKMSAPSQETAVTESVESIPFANSICIAANSVRERSETSVSEVPPIEVVVEIDSALSAETYAPVGAALMEQAGTLSVEELPCLHAHVTEESESADSNIATSADARTPEIEHQHESQRGTQWTPLYGRWLRERLQQKGIRTREVVKRLGVLPMDLNAVERLNILLPLAWIPGLLKLGAITETEAERRLSRSKSSTKNGRWLRKQRGQCGLTHAAVAAWLGVSRSDVKLVEARWAPLPIEWIPTLQELFAPRRGKRRKRPTLKSRAAPSPGTSQAPERVLAAVNPVSVPKPVPSQTALEQTEMIVNYRLMLGERVGLSAVEVLAQIAADLQLALGKDALTYEQLHAAVKSLTEQ